MGFVIFLNGKIKHLCIIMSKLLDDHLLCRNKSLLYTYIILRDQVSLKFEIIFIKLDETTKIFIKRSF